MTDERDMVMVVGCDVLGFVLQVGSFKTLEKANLLKKNLGKKGYPVFVEMARILGGDRVWHRGGLRQCTTSPFSVRHPDGERLLREDGPGWRDHRGHRGS